MRRRTRKLIGRTWGYVLLAVVLYGWFGANFGPGILATLSGVVVLYFLFQAPMWCCAVNRDGTYCRNNAGGLLLGCHLRHHKWQKIQLVVKQHSWAQVARQVLSHVGGQAATIGALASAVSAVTAVITVATV